MKKLFVLIEKWCIWIPKLGLENILIGFYKVGVLIAVFWGRKFKNSNTTLPDSGLLKYFTPLFMMCFVFQVFKIYVANFMAIKLSYLVMFEISYISPFSLLILMGVFSSFIYWYWPNNLFFKIFLIWLCCECFISEK